MLLVNFLPFCFDNIMELLITTVFYLYKHDFSETKFKEKDSSINIPQTEKKTLK